MEITEKQKIMLSAVGHEVEVFVVGREKPLIGKCTGFTQPLDNEPEVATITIKVDWYSGLFEITEEELDKLVFADDHSQK